MNKKSDTLLFPFSFININFHLVFFNVLFFSIFLLPSYFSFLMFYVQHTHFLSARKHGLLVAARLYVSDYHSLLWQHTSVFIVACDGSTPHCL